jgi:hypothetical protein
VAEAPRLAPGSPVLADLEALEGGGNLAESARFRKGGRGHKGGLKDAARRAGILEALESGTYRAESAQKVGNTARTPRSIQRVREP